MQHIIHDCTCAQYTYSTYTGDVVNGMRHGSGTYHSTATNTTYTGEWVDGKREGIVREGGEGRSEQMNE